MDLLVIFVIAMLVFGPQKVGDLGKGLGEAIRGFRQAIREEPASTAANTQSTPPSQAKDQGAKS